MIIAQISDTHIALDTEDSGQRIRDFEVVIEDINRLDPQPDLIIHTGDVVHNGRADEYEVATSILSKAKAPVFAIPGNKDKRQEMRDAFIPFGFLRGDSDFLDFSIEEGQIFSPILRRKPIRSILRPDVSTYQKN